MKTYTEIVNAYSRRLLDGANTETIAGETGYKGILSEFMTDIVDNEVVYSKADMLSALDLVKRYKKALVTAIEKLADYVSLVDVDAGRQLTTLLSIIEDMSDDDAIKLFGSEI